MVLYLLRHGTTSWNALRRIQGHSDIPLDAAGEEMARQTGQALAARGIRFDAVFSSPLVRARRSAELAAPDISITTDMRLAELSFGLFEGLNVEAMKADPACAFRYFKSDPARYDAAVTELSVQNPGAHFESLSELCRRTADFMKTVIEPAVLNDRCQCVLISGHGAMNRALLMYILGNTDLHAFWGNGLQANCGLTKITCRPGKDGQVIYETDDLSETFYDPAITRGLASLL